MMPAWLAAFASRIGLTGLAIAILLALLAVQTVRLEGLRVWPLSIEGARPKAERLQQDLDNVAQAQAIALERAEAAKFRAENKYRKLANRIDTDAQTAQADALADAERFIRDNRVRCETAGGASGRTVAASGDSGSASGNGPGQAPELVAVIAEDVRICTENTTRLEAVRAWALELGAD